MGENQLRIDAAILRDPSGRFLLESVELADPGPDQVLVRIAGVGMCHTDVLVRTQERFAPMPFLGGHEGAGVVERVGSAVTGIDVGAHVVLSFDSCGACMNCLRGHPTWCDTYMLRNWGGGPPGGNLPVIDAHGDRIAARWFAQSSFASYALATSRNAVVVDPSFPIELLGPLGCGLLTGAGAVLVSTRVVPASTVAVFGAGAVGLAAIMAAKIAGAANIVAVDIHDNRLELAQELGATHVLRGSNDDVAGAITRATGGADFAFDTTGVPTVVADAVKSLRYGGVCGLIGVATGPSVLETAALSRRSVMGIGMGDAIPQKLIPELLDFWAQGRFPFDRLIRT
jgi:aryl-alcohol dehydrogenase